MKKLFEIIKRALSKGDQSKEPQTDEHCIFPYREYLKEREAVLQMMSELPPIRCLEADDPARAIRRERDLDGVEDDTGINWLRIRESSSPEDALREFAALRAGVYAHEQLFSSFSYGRPKPWFLLDEKNVRLDRLTIILVPKNALVPEEKKEELRGICEENRVRLAAAEDYPESFRDLLFDRSYSLCVTEYPGSADDAATYGYISLAKEQVLTGRTE